MDDLIKKQIEFFSKNKTGCGFAAKAASNPKLYRWHHCISSSNIEDILYQIESAEKDPNISTLSILLPEVQTVEDLCEMISAWRTRKNTRIEYTPFQGYLCIGLRVSIGNEIAWVSGFGPFDFLPKTRQAPCVQLSLRVKPRPGYENVMEVMKKYTGKSIHLADMDMRGMADHIFKKIWKATHITVSKILGAKPNLLSAAKTTFTIPFSIALENIGHLPEDIGQDNHLLWCKSGIKEKTN